MADTSEEIVLEAVGAVLHSVVHLVPLPDITASNLSFSGHESFSLRYPWLPKAMMHLALDSNLFRSEGAIVKLGVGKNMVQSMRHWCRVTGLISRSAPETPTELGQRLFLEGGWDPYLEDVATQWLLHWQLVSEPDLASTWHYAFTRWSYDTFTKDQLLDWLADHSSKSRRVSRNTIKRDIDVFVRTYLPSEPGGVLTPEETFDSPLAELGLLEPAEGDSYAFVRSPQPTLPDEILVYALNHYWMRRAYERRSLDARYLLYGPGSLGGAFNLTGNDLFSRLERLPVWSGMRFDDTAGLKQVLKVAEVDPFEPLSRYYGSAG